MSGNLKYPIGKPQNPELITGTIIKDWISIIEQHPKKLTKLVQSLSQEQLDTTYRKDGWTIRQVIHHLSDNHHNSYTCFK